MTSPIPADDLARLFFAQQTGPGVNPGRLLPAFIVAYSGSPTYRNTVRLWNGLTTYEDCPVLWTAKDIGFSPGVSIVVMTTDAKPIIIDALVIPT